LCYELSHGRNAEIEQFLREALVSEKKHGYVIGVSGGLDSAVVLKLLVRAVGKENVLGLILPERDTERSQLLWPVRFWSKRRYLIKSYP